MSIDKMEIEESKIVEEALEGLTENTRMNSKTSLKQFLKFANSKEGLSKTISIDDVVIEAKEDVTRTQEHMDQFYRWSQNEKIEGYPLRGKVMRESSANTRTYGYLRGFFVNVGIGFDRKWKRKIPKVERPKQALKKDKVYTFYDVDEKTMTIRFNREMMQQFLVNLKLRDVAITLALLSSSQDSGDLFKLNVGDIREQKGISRIFWEDNRSDSSIHARSVSPTCHQPNFLHVPFLHRKHSGQNVSLTKNK